MPNDIRRDLGATGEQLAADHLTRRGLTILDRNFRTRYGELDIVAYDEHTTVFCEVKSRKARGMEAARDPLESVHPQKRRQVRQMAGIWLATRQDRPRTRELRFDVVGITLAPDGTLLRLDHIEAAF